MSFFFFFPSSSRERDESFLSFLFQLIFFLFPLFLLFSSRPCSSPLSHFLSLSPPFSLLLQVYVTMYLNDHARSPFYESLGLNTKQFNQHVILETNKTTERIFPEVPDVEDAAFFPRLDRMVALAERLTAIGGSDAPGPLKTLQKVPVLASFVGELLAMFFSPVKSTGSADLVPEVQAVY